MLVRNRLTNKVVELVWIIVDAVPTDAYQATPEEIIQTWTPTRSEGYALVTELPNGVKEFKVAIRNRHLWKMLNHLNEFGYLGMLDMGGPIPIGE